MSDYKLLLDRIYEQQLDDFGTETGLAQIINGALEENERRQIEEAQGVPILVNFLEKTENPVLQMYSLWALANLATADKNRTEAVSYGALAPISSLLKDCTNEDVLIKSFWLLTNLTNNPQCCANLIEDGFPRLLADRLELAKPEVLFELLTSLHNLLLDERSQNHFIDADGINRLVFLLKKTEISEQDSGNSLLLQILNVVKSLVSRRDDIRNVIGKSKLMPFLVKYLSSKNDEVVERAVEIFVFLSLTAENENAILESEAVIPLIDLVQYEHSFQKKVLLLLSNLSCNAEINTFFRYTGLAKPLTRFLKSDDDQLLLHTGRIIANICTDDYCRMEIKDLVDLADVEKLLGHPKEDIQKAAKRMKNNITYPVPESVRDDIATNYTGLSMKDKEKDQGPTIQQKKGQKDREILRRQATQIHPLYVRRKKIVKEFYDTEKTYVSSLTFVKKMYLDPISISIIKDQPIISSEQTKNLFSIIEIIQKIHKNFLDELEPIVKSWSPSSTVGETIIKLVPKLKVYTRYINNYENTMQTYTSCMKGPKFSALVEENRQHPDSQGLDLASFLIMPIQRIPRYLLLLDDLKKNTPHDHEDFQKLHTAYDELKSTADYLNESKKQAEKKSRVQSIESQLIDCKEPLSKNGRVFIKEGTVLRKESLGSKYFHLFLFSDILLVTTVHQEKYKMKKMYQLHEIVVKDVPESKEYQNAFQIVHGKEALILSANNKKEKDDWIFILKKSIFYPEKE